MSILTSNMKVTKIVQKHFLCTFWGFLVTIICDVKIDFSMCEPHCVNLFFLWTSSIVHVFDNLTSFWQLDNLLTTWHLFWYMGKGKCRQMGIMVNTKHRDGAPWGMGQWATWSMWSCAWSCATSLTLFLPLYDSTTPTSTPMTNIFVLIYFVLSSQWQIYLRHHIWTSMSQKCKFILTSQLRLALTINLDLGFG